MFQRIMAGPARFAVYFVVIAIAVATGLYFLQVDETQRLASLTGGSFTSEPPPPWKTSAKAVEEANEGLTVKSAAPHLQPLAGTTGLINWPQFNGSARDNRSSDQQLLPEWPETGPPLAWIAEGVGIGYATVAVVEGRVFTVGNKGDVEALICLDVGTGQKLWSTPFARASHPSYGDGPRSTPAVDDGLVYVLGAEGALVCCDAKTGSVVWSKNILTEFEASRLGFGMCESVLIDGDVLICAPGGKKATVVALEKRTGNVRWQCKIEGERASYASASIAEFDGVRQIVHFLGGHTVGIRRSDGQFLWKNSRAANPQANCCSPLVIGNRVFSASSYGTGGALLSLTVDGTNVRADQQWDTKEMCCHHGEMVVANGCIFGCHEAILSCLDVETGKVRWKSRSVGKAAITYAEDKLYVRGEGQEIALVDASPDQYTERGRFTQPERSSQSAWPHPVVAHGRLFLRDQNLLLCYNLHTTP